MTSARNLHRNPAIIGLFFRRRPFAIGWIIVSAIIYAINRMTRGWLPAHIGVEVFEARPSVADGNAASAIVLVMMIVMVAASIEHRGPRSIFRSSVHPVFDYGANTGGIFDLQTAARSRLFMTNIACACGEFFSAITSKFPNGVAVMVALSKFYGEQTPIPLTRCHGWEFSALSHFDLQDRLKWLGPAGVISTAFRAAFCSTYQERTKANV